MLRAAAARCCCDAAESDAAVGRGRRLDGAAAQDLRFRVDVPPGPAVTPAGPSWQSGWAELAEGRDRIGRGGAASDTCPTGHESRSPQAAAACRS